MNDKRWNAFKITYYKVATNLKFPPLDFWLIQLRQIKMLQNKGKIDIYWKPTMYQIFYTCFSIQN